MEIRWLLKNGMAFQRLPSTIIHNIIIKTQSRSFKLIVYLHHIVAFPFLNNIYYHILWRYWFANLHCDREIYKTRCHFVISISPTAPAIAYFYGTCKKIWIMQERRRKHNSVQHLSSQNLYQSLVSIGFDLILTIYLTISLLFYELHEFILFHSTIIKNG